MDNDVACLTEVSIVIKWFKQKSLQFSGSCLEFWLSFLLYIIFLPEGFLRRRIGWLPDSGFVLRLDKSDPGPVSAGGPDLCPWRLAALTLEVASPSHRHTLLLSSTQTWVHGSKVLLKVWCDCSAHVCCMQLLLITDLLVVVEAGVCPLQAAPALASSGRSWSEILRRAGSGVTITMHAGKSFSIQFSYYTY